MKRSTVYIDESGNTGSNLLDTQQPIFTLIGVGIVHDHMVDILKRIDEIKAIHKIPMKNELHAKNLRSHRRDHITKDIIDILIEHKTIFFILIVEKRFTIASSIDNDFFDPVYNDRCDNSWTFPNGKNERANFLYVCLSEEAMNACGISFCTGENLRDAYQLVLRDIEGKHHEPNLHYILQGAELHLNQLSKTIQDANTSAEPIDLRHKVLKSPNLFSFCDLLNKIENFYRNNGFIVDVVFDSAHQYNASFSQFFEKLKTAEKSSLILEGSIPRLFGYESMKTFETIESKESAFLQITDMIATSINNLIRKISEDNGSNEYSEYDCFLLRFIFTFNSIFGDQFISFVVSDKILDKIGIVFNDSC